MHLESISYKNNITLYKYYLIFSSALFIWPVKILYYQSKGLNFTQIMFVSSISGILTLFAEIPTGIFSDKFGAKKSINLGLLLYFFSLMILFLSKSFYMIIFYAILGSLSSAFISGSSTALLYESLKITGDENDYRKVLRRINEHKMYFMSFVTLFSGFLYEINTNLPCILSIIFIFISFILSIMFKDVNINSEDNKSIGFINTSLDLFKNNKQLKWITFVSIIFIFYFSNLNYVAQGYMKEINIPARYFGLIFFISNIISARAIKFSSVFDNKFKHNTKVVLSIYLSVCFILIFLLKNTFAIVFICLCRVASGVILTNLDSDVNKIIDSKNRATMLSIQSAAISLTSFLLDPMLGYFIDTKGIFLSYLLLGVTCLLFSLALYQGRKYEI